MSVHQTPDGRWFCKYHQPGEKTAKRKYFGRGVEAEKAALEFHAALGIKPQVRRLEGETLTFKVLAEGYLKAKLGSIEESTRKILNYKLTAYMMKAIGHYQAAKITPALIDKYVAVRLEAGRRRSTVRRELTDIQAILNWAVDRKLIPLNPIRGYKKPQADDRIRQPVTNAELDALLQHAAPNLIRAMILGYYTGARPGKELFGLTWRDVDFERGKIRVTSARKHGPPYRDVPIHPELEPYLRAWHEEDGKGTGHIVRSKNGPVRTLQKVFETAKRKSKIGRPIQLYAFRHAFATRILEDGGNPKATSELLGHSTPEIMMRVYQHVTGALHESTIRKLPGIRKTVPDNPGNHEKQLPSNVIDFKRKRG